MGQELTIEVVADGSEIALRGRLDVRTAPAARAALHRLVEAGSGDVVVHAGELEIWDSCGLGVLVGAHRKARRRDRRLVLAGLPPRELRLLRATRLSRVLVVTAQAPAAV